MLTHIYLYICIFFKTLNKKVIIVEIANRVIKGMLYMYIKTTESVHLIFCVHGCTCVNIKCVSVIYHSPFDLVHLLLIASFKSLPFFMVAGLSPQPCWPDARSAVSVL